MSYATCPNCKAKAKIYSRSNVCDLLSNLYFVCPTCGHTFVCRLEFSHSISVPREEPLQTVKTLLEKMLPQEQTQKLVNEISDHIEQQNNLTSSKNVDLSSNLI